MFYYSSSYCGIQILYVYFTCPPAYDGVWDTKYKGLNALTCLLRSLMTSPLLSYSPLFPMILIHPSNQMYLLSIWDVPVSLCIKSLPYKNSTTRELDKKAWEFYMEDLLALRGMMLLPSPGWYCLPHNRPINWETGVGARNSDFTQKASRLRR